MITAEKGCDDRKMNTLLELIEIENDIPGQTSKIVHPALKTVSFPTVMLNP